MIVQRVLEQARSNGGNIVLLHDGGGDRTQTVLALPQIIDGLRAAGFQIVPVSELVGQTRAQLMPPLTFRERLVAHADGLIFTMYEWSRLSVAFIFVLGIGLVSCRAIIVGLLAIIEKFRPAPPDQPDFQPMVSVLIPAYNEEDVIVYTVNSVLESDYPRLEVIVVDDGSTDGTGELLDAQFGRNPAVRIIHQPNSGKPAALSHALAEASSSIIVTIDADTAIEPDAISKLVRHFVNPRVGAVAGNVKVGNRISWLTRWQALEYVTSQNLEKRAFDLLNCIPVVPGALSAWRAEAINDSGGFSADTVAEDTDLTITIRRAGLENRLRGRSDWLDRSAGNRVHADPPAIPLDVRHAAGVLETSRHAGTHEIRDARLDRAAQHVSVPASVAAVLSGDRSAVPRLAGACTGLR